MHTLNEEYKQMNTNALHTDTVKDNVFAYIRVSTASQCTDSQLVEMPREAQVTVEHGVSGTVPAKERPELSRLLDKLRRNDTLYVWWVDRLGRDYNDVETTMRELLHRGVCIKTINQGLTFAYTGNDMQDMTTNIQITMLTAMASAERQNRLASAEAGRQAIKAKPELWSEKFKGRKADTKLHDAIISKLNEGLSIRKTAEQLGCNPSTVQRVKKQTNQ